MMGLLLYKYEPFWQEVSVKSLILTWPLRPLGLLLEKAGIVIFYSVVAGKIQCTRALPTHWKPPNIGSLFINVASPATSPVKSATLIHGTKIANRRRAFHLRQQWQCWRHRFCRLNGKRRRSFCSSMVLQLWRLHSSRTLNNVQTTTKKLFKKW